MRNAGTAVTHIALILVAAAVSARPQEIPEAPVAWEREIAGRVVALSVSPDGRCVVAATTRGLVLLGADGELRWQRPHFNQWMAASAEKGWNHALAPKQALADKVHAAEPKI